MEILTNTEPADWVQQTESSTQTLTIYMFLLGTILQYEFQHVFTATTSKDPLTYTELKRLKERDTSEGQTSWQEALTLSLLTSTRKAKGQKQGKDV